MLLDVDGGREDQRPESRLAQARSREATARGPVIQEPSLSACLELMVVVAWRLVSYLLSAISISIVVVVIKATFKNN